MAGHCAGGTGEGGMQKEDAERGSQGTAEAEFPPDFPLSCGVNTKGDRHRRGDRRR
jgi:hypothetical protein